MRGRRREGAYNEFVHDYGGVPFAVRDGVVGAITMGDAARAYWVQGRYLRIVDVSTGFNRDTNPYQAEDDVRTVVSGLLSLDSRGCCD